jgi:putative membrane protein
MGRIADAKNGLVGAFIGVLSILPGASGGVAAVVFGIYERLMEDLGDIFHKWRTDFRFLLFVGGGMVLGMAVTAFGLDWLMANLEVPAMFFFTGLIIGQFPDVYKMTKEDGKKSSALNYVALAAGIAVTVLLMFAGSIEGTGGDGVVAHGGAMYVVLIVAGLVIAASKIAPGVSGSAILLAMGLYKPLINSFTDFDLVVIVLFGIGLVTGLVLFAKIVTWALRSYRKSTFHMIFGLTVGSTLLVAYNTLTVTDTWIEAAGGVTALVLGLALSLWLSRLSEKYSNELQG